MATIKSIEEKAKAYDEALNRAKKELDACGSQDCDATRQIFRLFPELAELEDEKMRKGLIIYLRSILSNKEYGDKFIEDWIAWLEKQGEQKPVFEMRTPEESLSIDSDTYNKIVDECIYGEQPADKVEPKFKVGDWVVSDDKDVHDDYRVCKIIKIDDGRYYIEGGDFLSESSLALYEYRLWTIQDAKDGDVLKEDSCTFIIERMKPDGTAIIHCCLFDDCYFDLVSTLSFDVDSTKPATKEQRDLLFQKMKEEGYEWDADKKELKKIEQKPIEWSKVDETALCDALWCCKQAASIAKDENDMGNIWYAENWLKSLKDRVQPKQEWSEEDRKLIDETCNLINTLASGYGEKVTEPISFAGVQQIASIKDRLRALVDNRPQNTWKPSKTAEERALEAYPVLFGERHGYDNTFKDRRESYIKGYHQAEKDLELTVDDVKNIDRLLNQCVDCSNPYQEVLKRFKERKGE